MNTALCESVQGRAAQGEGKTPGTDLNERKQG